MPIRIDYSPVGPLLGLAHAAGIGERQRRGEATDLAFVQMSLAAQARNAQIAAQIQAQDQAFALQQAAAARIAGTPTRVQPSDSVFGRMQWQESQRGLQRDAQLEQLNAMRATGQIDQKQFDQAKLGMLTDNEALVRGALQPKQPKPKPVVSIAQELSYFDDRWKRQLDPIQREIAQLQKEWMADSKIYDKDGRVVPELREQEQQRKVKVGNRLNALRVHERDLMNTRSQEMEAFKQAHQPTGQELEAGPTGAARPAVEDLSSKPIPLPPARAMWSVGQVYIAPDGRIGRWNGATFESVE